MANVDFRENNVFNSRDQFDPYLPSACTSGEDMRDCDSTSLYNSWEKQPIFKSGVQGVQQMEDSVFVIDFKMLSKKESEGFKKLFKSSFKDQGKAAKGEKRDRKEEVAEFLKHYPNGNFADVAVSQLRHVIPLLLMEVYAEKHGHYSAKVKGLWEKRPDDWDEKVPFLDPNNNIKTDGKPGSKPIKEVLMLMLNFLVTKYKKSMAEKRTFPHQVQDTEDDDQGSRQSEPLKDPVRELVDRIKSRLRGMENFPWASSYITSLQTNLDLIRTYTSECVMAYGHILELFVDYLTKHKSLPPDWHDQMTNMQNILGSLFMEMSMNSVHWAAAGEVQSQSEVSTSGSGCLVSAKSVNANVGTGESMQDFIPKMNIKARGDADPMLVSDVTWRADLPVTECPAGKGCCDMQECHGTMCDDGNLCNDVDLSQIVQNPEYNSDVLLDVIDQQIASGELAYVEIVASQTGDQGFNFQENEWSCVDVQAFTLANSNVAHHTASAIPLHHTPHVPVTNSSSVTFTYPVTVSQIDMELGDAWKQVISDDSEVVVPRIPPIDQSPLTGCFEQMTLQNDHSPTAAFPLNEISGFETAVVPSPADVLITDSISLNSATQIRAQPPIAGKRVAPIPVMVETADDFEEHTFTAPSMKRSRQSNARR